MKLILHLIKFNFILHKYRILFYFLVSAIITFVSIKFNENIKLAGESMLQYSMYGMFIILAGKLNSKSQTLFDIKSLYSLPLSKIQVVVYKSFADLVHFFPLSIVFSLGFTFRWRTIT